MYIVDTVNSILQGFMFVLAANYCVEEKYKKNKGTVILIGLIIWLTIQISFHFIGNTSLNILITHFVPLIILCIVYNKDLLGANIAFNIIYLMIAINLLVVSNILVIFFETILYEHYDMRLTLVICYALQFIMTYFILKNMDKIYNIYRVIRSKQYSILSLIIITIAVDFITSFRLIIHEKDNPIFKNLMFTLLAIFVIMITFYYANIEKKIREITALNYELEEKIRELKKVKHDYGAQISYLYGLHLMERYQRLGTALRDIINGHDSIIDSVHVSNDSDSLISIITESIVTNGVNLIIDEQADLEEADISEMELQRIISNIVTNSLTAMNGNGRLTIRTYYKINNIVIKIENNGPEIDRETIGLIFEPGFSTKENEDENHGFGLSIVKEIIEGHNGRVTVSSNPNGTEFKLILPRKNN